MSTNKPAMLAVNLGSPNTPTVADVRAYLREFLMDPLVLDIAWPLRWLLVNCIIAPSRGPKSAKLYQKIWDAKNGSPLIHYSKLMTAKLAAALPEMPVRLAMRYGEPDLRRALHELIASGADTLYVMPMYPQYALSSTESVLSEVRKICRELRFSGRLLECQGFAIHPGFVAAVTEKIRAEIQNFSPDHLLLSYHGLPKSQLKNVPPQLNYRDQCFATSEAIAKSLASQGVWVKEKITVGFQSRLTNGWIQPYSDYFYRTMPSQGVRRLLVACPSFVADCLETLEEVAMRGREEFREHGGDDLRLVPGVNDSDLWVGAAASIVRDANYWREASTSG